MPPAIIVLARGLPQMPTWLADVTFGIFLLTLVPPVAVIAYCVREVRSWKR